MYNKNSYVVEELELEVITITAPRPVMKFHNKNASRFRQAIDNIAMSVLRGEIEEFEVRNNLNDTVYSAVLIAMDRFGEISHMYSSSSPLHGVTEYLDPEVFSFTSTVNDAQYKKHI